MMAMDLDAVERELAEMRRKMERIEPMLLEWEKRHFEQRRAEAERDDNKPADKPVDKPAAK
jgi:hypothetical protein